MNGLVVAVIGLGTVFVVLGVLWGILEISKRIFAPRKKADTRPEPQAAAPVEQPAPAKAAEMEDGELIAVLTAAVAASLNTSTYRLRIQSYREVNAGTPVWNRAARTENVK